MSNLTKKEVAVFWTVFTSPVMIWITWAIFFAGQFFKDHTFFEKLCVWSIFGGFWIYWLFRMIFELYILGKIGDTVQNMRDR